MFVLRALGDMLYYILSSLGKSGTSGYGVCSCVFESDATLYTSSVESGFTFVIFCKMRQTAS